jgi:sentrin-specific protease 1
VTAPLTGHARTAVCTGLNLKVTRGQLDCANRIPTEPHKPPDWKWLNDEVANAVLELLQQRELDDSPSQPRVHYCNTFFYKALYKEGHYDFSQVQRWTSTSNLTYDILKCKKIVVPIHQGMHWVLAVIHVTDRRLEFLDSMGRSEGKTLVRTRRFGR